MLQRSGTLPTGSLRCGTWEAAQGCWHGTVSMRSTFGRHCYKSSHTEFLTGATLISPLHTLPTHLWLVAQCFQEALAPLFVHFEFLFLKRLETPLIFIIPQLLLQPIGESCSTNPIDGRLIRCLSLCLHGIPELDSTLEPSPKDLCVAALSSKRGIHHLLVWDVVVYYCLSWCVYM